MGLGFSKAVREQVWIKMLLSGTSGSGKSMSALEVGSGIAEKCGSRVAMISTEGSRSKYYADLYDFDLLELDDYTPEGYINAINLAIREGYKVVILDTISNEWKTLNDIHDKMPGNSFQNWGKLKPRHQKFMENILKSPVHLICTARGKTEWSLEEDERGKKVPKKIGMGNEQDKQISYEYTVSLMLDNVSHVASTDKDNTRLFDGKYEVLTREHGYKLYDWANSGEKPAEPVVMPTAEPAVDPAEELKSIKTAIIKRCTELGGTKHPTLMDTLKTFVPSGNPNAIRDVEKAKACLAAVNSLSK